MSADPSLDLQKAVVSALRSSSPSIADGRIYDDPPISAQFPYVSYGSDQVFSDDVDCIVSFEIFLSLDVWSRAVGQPEMKRIIGEIRQALHGADLSLDDFALVSIEHNSTRYLDDPDGKTKHGIVEFRALVDGAE